MITSYQNNLMILNRLIHEKYFYKHCLKIKGKINFFNYKWVFQVFYR
jgi:hypothetical protein